MLIVTEPLDPVDMPMLVPATRYEVPSVSLVSEPLKPCGALIAPEMMFVPSAVPMLMEVAAPAKFTVVADVFTRSKLAPAVMIFAEVMPSPTLRMWLILSNVRPASPPNVDPPSLNCT